MLSLARAKKKLRYFRAEEKTPCELQIKDVFTLNDLDNIFDDLDSPSESATPLLSPLPKSAELVEPASTSHSPELKPLSPFEADEPEVLEPEVLEPKTDLHDDHLNDKGSPFKAIVPIKTSSPIDMTSAGSGTATAEQPDPSPLSFGGEDEEPVEGDLKLPSSSQRPRPPKKLLQGDSDVLESPPARLEFAKPSNLDDVSVLRNAPLKSSAQPDLECQTSAPQTQEKLQTDRSPSPPLAAQGSPSDPLPQEQCKGQELKLDSVVKTSQRSFQQKLRNALQSKSSCFRKQDSLKRPVRAPSPVQVDDDDDFMILEDDAPILFTIPRRQESIQKGKTAPEVPKPNRTEVSEVEQAAPKPTEDAGKSLAPKLKATVQKGANPTSETTETEEVLGENVEPLGPSEDISVCQQISCPNLPASQKVDLPDTDKQKTRSKTKPDQVENKCSQDGVQAKTPHHKASSKRRKSAKLTTHPSTRKEESNVKKKPNTARSTIKISGPVSASLGPAKRRTPQGKRRLTVQMKKASKDQERGDGRHHQGEAEFTTPEPQQVQSTITAGKEAAKQSTTKPTASERLTKIRKVKAKENSKTKERTVPECDRSAEAPVPGKRRRRPPGEWWLTFQGESFSQEALDHQSLQEQKSHKKIKRQAAPSRPADCAEELFPGPVQESPREPQSTVTGRKVSRKGKKPSADVLKSNSMGEQKTPKVARGKRKPKTVTASQRETSVKTTPLTPPAPAVGVEVEDCSPLGQHSSPPLRQRSLTPGNKRMFDQIYTRDARRGSAQKCRPSQRRGPETIPEKRQRKAPGTWWEVQPSQRSPDASPPPLNCSPVNPVPQKACHHGASVVSSRKVAARAQKTNMSNTPKSVRRSLATFSAVLASGKAELSRARGLGRKGCRNLLHSLEEQSERSGENVHTDGPPHTSSNATFDVCVSGVATEPVSSSRKMDGRLSAGSRVSDHDIGLKSGPSSMIELERYEEDEDADLPSSRVAPQMPRGPRVLSDCELCGPPLRPIVLESEDWDNLCAWLTHLWPPSSKNGHVISPDDFHWYSCGGRGMGHVVDLQHNTFSNGKILLGSFMKKPPQVDLNAVTVFNVVSSCVRVEIEGIKAVYNSGQTFVTPCGQSYSIHNICREPAVLWYNRMLPYRSGH